MCLVEKCDNFENRELNNVVTPVDTDVYEEMLVQSNYDEDETSFLVKGFREGFSLCHEGPRYRKDTSKNIPITVGSKTELWNKIMKEVKTGHYAGPFKKPPFKYFIQSPIELVPKAGNKTRLIFHLSYDFPNGNYSVNAWTPSKKCTIKYSDLDHVVQNCIELLRRTGAKHIFYSKSDLMSAFRILPILPRHRRFLLMAADHPETGVTFFFAEKNLPFGASISCSHFTRFSNSLRHLVETRLSTRYVITNYLDDFLFIDTTKQGADHLVRNFLEVCSLIKSPVSLDKTEWGSIRMTFLGILLDGEEYKLCILEEKR